MNSWRDSLRLAAASVPTIPSDLDTDRRDESALGYGHLFGATPDHRAALAVAGVPERILGRMFRDGQRGPFEPDTPEMVVTLARRIAKGESLYLHGATPGAGKSHVAACGLYGRRRVGKLPDSCIAWAEWPLALHRLREEQRSDTDEAYMDALTKADVLVLDDLGPTCRPTPFAVDALQVVVRQRYNDMRQTVMTSQWSPSELDAHLQAAGFPAAIVEPLVSRMVGAAGGPECVVPVVGRDRRMAARVGAR